MNVTEAMARQLLCPMKRMCCQAAGCMAWRWAKGNEEADEEIVVWNRTSDPLSDSVTLDGAERQRRLDEWQPFPPRGDGWELIEKAWLFDDIRPSARFRRPILDRKGHCGLVAPPVQREEAL